MTKGGDAPIPVYKAVLTLSSPIDDEAYEKWYDAFSDLVCAQSADQDPSCDEVIPHIMVGSAGQVGEALCEQDLISADDFRARVERAVGWANERAGVEMTGTFEEDVL